MDREAMCDSILKTAGFGSAIGRTIGGAALGAGLGATKGVSANANDPGAHQSTKELNVLGGATGGALAGGAALGMGGHFTKKLGKGIAGAAKGILKKSDMEVPNDEEKGLCHNDTDDVKESPNEEEKNRMMHSLPDDRKEIYKQSIENKAMFAR